MSEVLHGGDISLPFCALCARISSVPTDTKRGENACKVIAVLAFALMLNACRSVPADEAPSAVPITPRLLAEIEQDFRVEDSRGKSSEYAELTVPAGDELYAESTVSIPAFERPEQARFYFSGTFPDLARRYYRALQRQDHACLLPEATRMKLIGYTEDGNIVCVEHPGTGRRWWTSMRRLLNRVDEEGEGAPPDAGTAAASDPDASGTAAPAQAQGASPEPGGEGNAADAVAPGKHTPPSSPVMSDDAAGQKAAASSNAPQTLGEPRE